MKANNLDQIINKYGLWIVIGFAIIVLLPVLIDFFPLYYSTPDIQYVKAKVYRVQMGDCYADPVTGFDNFHPPFYHYFLAFLLLIGFSIDYALFFTTLLVVFLTICLIYKITARQFDEKTGVLTALLYPFFIEYMGCSNVFLATAFYFAIPFYLGGLWFFLPTNRSNWNTILYAVLWGLTYNISPAYLFLIGMPMLYELFIRKDMKRFGMAFGIMMFVLIPFWHQAYSIFSQDLFGTSAFSFWRGFPDGEFFKTLVEYIVNPTEKDWTNPLVWAAFGLTIWAIVTIIRVRATAKTSGIKWYLIAVAIGYILTFYHFKPQYAIRVHLFLAILLVAYWIHALLSDRKLHAIVIWTILVLIVAGTGYHLHRSFTLYRIQDDRLKGIFQTCNQFVKAFPNYISPNDYVLAFHGTYRHYILPYHPAHALKAYDSGEYFQLTSTLSEDYEKDYNLAMECNNENCLRYVCNKYNIKFAVVNAGDMKLPVFQYINSHWKTIYSDPYFRIYSRP